MRRLFFVLILIVGFCFCCFGLDRVVKITPLDGSDDVLKVYEVCRNVEVAGNYCSTTVEFMIENRSTRVMEGEFVFPLADGEKISGYALDINGKYRDAVVIEKERGRVVFEDVVRRGVDPALVEQLSGNNFRTRVYPIAANGVRHIKITFDKEVFDDALFGKNFIQTVGKKTYFYFCENLSDLNNEKSVRTDFPASLAIAFDVSASANNRDLKKEMQFLTSYLGMLLKKNGFSGELLDDAKNVNGLSKRCLKVVVRPFSECERPESKAFDVVSESDVAEIVNFLMAIPFDGGTCFDLDFSNDSVDEILLFSDGMQNLNEGSGEKSLLEKCKIPVLAVNSCVSADIDRLKWMAIESGGRFVDLDDCAVQKCLENLCVEQIRILDVQFDGKVFNEVYPCGTGIVDGILSVAGILDGKDGVVKISVGRGNRTLKTIERKVSAIPSEKNLESSFVKRLWAGKKIDELSRNYAFNRNRILEVSKENCIVTKETSLIVLDSVHDYVRYKIQPPSDLMEEYKRIISSESGAFGKPKKDFVPDVVYRNFSEYCQWWNKKPEDFKKIDVEKPFVDRRRGGRNRVMELESTTETAAFEDSAVMENDFLQVREERAFEAPAALNALSKRELESSENHGGKALGAIALKEWESNAPYLSELKKTSVHDMHGKYLELKKDYGKSVAFYMEVADCFWEVMELRHLSWRILSNLCELEIENTDVLRAMGYKLVQWQDYEKAVMVFEKLVSLRSETPQFLRDLALCESLLGKKQQACDHLWKIVENEWDHRFSDIQQTVLNDMNAIIDECETRGQKIDVSAYDKKLLKNFYLDVRIVLTWNTDDCDIDLWVTDPDGEKCYYGHRLTKNGGRMSCDFTQGYGPEEFSLKVAKKGEYKIQANYFGNHQQKKMMPVIVQAECYINFGKPDQKREVLTLQLDDVKQTFDVGVIGIQ